LSYDPKVWTIDPVAVRGLYWFIDASVFGPTVVDAHPGDVYTAGYTRSLLPVCSAERHAALERLARVVREQIASGPNADPDEIDAALAAVEATR
jgi:hypothetical protein